MPFGDIDEDAPAPRRTALDFIRDMQAQRKAAAVRTVQLRDTQRPEFVLTCRVPSDMDEMFDLETRAKEAATVEGSPSFEVVDDNREMFTGLFNLPMDVEVTA